MPNYTVAGQVPDPSPLGLSQAPAPQSPASTPDQSLGLTSPPANVASPAPQSASPAPDYGNLLGDASAAYLANGGSQANVDAYIAANPGQNYGQLASDAAQWYTGLNPGDAGNQDVANYFGIAPPAAGQNYNYTGAGTPAPAAPPAAPASPYPPEWIAAYNQMDPATQAAVAARYGGMTPDQIRADWEQNVMPQYAPGTSNQQILGGITRNPWAAMQQGEQNFSGPGSGSVWDPWLVDPTSPNAPRSGTGSMPAGRPATPPPGYGMGAPTPETLTFPGGGTQQVQRPGSMVKWDQPEGPQGGYTQAGKQQMAQPITAAGQTFPNFQAFLDFMRTSTPAEQGIKTQLEGAKNPAGGSLFDALAPYLTPNATQPPAGATPFTNWNPVSLLQLLMKSGLLK